MPDLRDVANRKTVRLVTRGRKSGKPRAVTIWFATSGPRSILVQHVSRKPAQWYRNLVHDPAVELDFGDGALAARAVPLQDAGEVQRVLAAIRRKHWLLAPLIQLLGSGADPVAAEITLVD